MSTTDQVIGPTEINKFAIVVGVNNSSMIPPNWPTLEYAEDDAKEVAYLLERPACKFKLVKPALIGKEAIASHIRRAVVDLVMGRTDQDLLLFYFSGHAQQMNDDIYFVTDDFDKGKVKVDPGGYISMRWLHRVLYQSIGAGCALIILDCCYAGNIAEDRDDLLHENFQTLLDKWDKGPHDKAQQNCSRLILAATGYDVEALEISGHGLLTRFLLRALGGDEDDKAYDNEGRVDILSLFEYLQKKLPKEHFSTLSGKFTARWILASYPRLSEHFRQQIKENELKSELGKEVSKNIMAELRKLYTATQHSQPFDYSRCPYASFSDLDPKKVSEFFKQERVQQEETFRPDVSDQDQLQQFGFLQNEYPTYGALLCFGQNLSQWVSSAITRCVEWDGNERGDRLQNSREFRGSLLRQFELGLDFLRKSLRLSRVIGREESIEEWEIPTRVLQETLANALVHREYANRTDFLQIEVFDDRVEISNPGDLPQNVTIELLQTRDASYPRNPQIAGIFYLYNYIEKLGTGIQRIHRLMKDAGLPDPEFKPDDKRFKVILYRPRQVRDNLVAQGSVNQAEISARPSSATGTASPSGEQVSVWNVPFRRNPFFTGREPIFAQIHSLLHAGKTTALSQPPAISGLGGIGKTQTAVEYAYRYREEYQHVLWVQANTSETLLSNFVTLAGLLKLPEQDAREQQLVVQVLKHWLETHSAWLLIFDNADDLAMLQDYLPTGNAGHILLTTRAQAMGGFARKIELDTMSSEEGASLLLRRAGLIAPDATLENTASADRALAINIVRAMDGLPLALDQAGAYIEETGCGLSRYLELYQKQGAQLLKRRGGVSSDHPQPVATTWSLSFEKVERANPAAADLLRLCAFLFPDAIPEEIITKGAPDLGRNLETVAADTIKLNAAIGELLIYSLVRRNPNQTLAVHRLVQAMLRDEMNEETQRQWVERAVRAVNRAFPDVGVSTWPECQRLLPNAQVCAVLIEQWHIEFEEAARLLSQTGQYLQARAQFAEAEPFYQRALTIREQILGSEDPDVAQSLNNLALLYQAQGKYEQVEPLYQRALAIDERVLGPEHPEVVTDLNNLALLYYNQRKYTEAEPLYQRALIIDERVLGHDHPEVATDLNNLALLYQAQGKNDQAEPFLQRALTTREKILGPEHPDTAISLNNLASLYYYQGKYIQAEPLLQRALMIWEKVLGPEHPSVAPSLENYATLLRETKREQEARTLEERARAIRARHAQENPTL